MRHPCAFISSAYSSTAATAATAAATAALTSTSSFDSGKSPLPSVPMISIDDLRLPSESTREAVQEAFTGRSSLGSISVRYPGFDKIRQKALRASAWFALEPSAARARDSCRKKELGRDARVQPGWSGYPGKEDHPIQSGFYCNLQEELEMAGKIDEIFGSNVWPAHDLMNGSIDFKEALLDVGHTMHEVTSLVLEAAREAAKTKARGMGKYCDFKNISSQSDSFLPLRMTYYDAHHSREDKITGGKYLLPWHVDFNLATAFMSAGWIHEERALNGEGIEVKCDGNNPEKENGLLLRNASGDIVPASIAEDCILIQLGAYAQLASGGLLRAGPHAVACKSEQEKKSLGRLNVGLFTYAPWDANMLPPSAEDKKAVLEDDFGGLMKKAYTGETVLSGFQSFQKYMNAPRPDS